MKQQFDVILSAWGGLITTAYSYLALQTQSVIGDISLRIATKNYGRRLSDSIGLVYDAVVFRSLEDVDQKKTFSGRKSTLKPGGFRIEPENHSSSDSEVDD